MKTAVETIFVGKGLLYNSSFIADLQPLPGRSGCLHPASGLGEGQSKPVGLVRRASSTTSAAVSNPRRVERVAAGQVQSPTPAHRQPNWPNRRVWEVFEAERPKLFPNAGGSTIPRVAGIGPRRPVLGRFDNNKSPGHGQLCRVGLSEVHAYGRLHVIRHGTDAIVAEAMLRRSFRTRRDTYDPWHYVPVCSQTRCLAQRPPSRTGCFLRFYRTCARAAMPTMATGRCVDYPQRGSDRRLAAVEAACAEASLTAFFRRWACSTSWPASVPAPPANFSTPTAALTLGATPRRHVPVPKPQVPSDGPYSTLRLMGELKPTGMKMPSTRSWQPLGQLQSTNPQRIVGALLNAEINENAARLSISTQLTIATLPLAKIRGLPVRRHTHQQPARVNDLVRRRLLAAT